MKECLFSPLKQFYFLKILHNRTQAAAHLFYLKHRGFQKKLYWFLKNVLLYQMTPGALPHCNILQYQEVSRIVYKVFLRAVELLQFGSLNKDLCPLFYR